jgi:hypothetical protein
MRVFVVWAKSSARPCRERPGCGDDPTIQERLLESLHWITSINFSLGPVTC